MAFGISGLVSGTTASSKFAGPIETAEAQIAALPAGKVSLIKIYAHGQPGAIHKWTVFDLERMLKPKMKADGQIHLLGCATAGTDAHPWNPIGGWGVLLRAVTFGLIDPSLWADNLAKELSVRIPAVWVLGLTGISWPLSRIANVVGLEGYEPTGLMADRQVYKNGRRSKPPGGGLQY